MTMTQSHRFMTTFMSCSIRKNVLPPCRSFSIRSMRLPVKAGFTPATGSSRRTSAGSDIKARESSRSFFWPPDSVLAVGAVETCNDVEQRVFSGPVRPDEAGDGLGEDRQTAAVHGMYSTERLVYGVHPENRFGGHP